MSVFGWMEVWTDGWMVMMNKFYTFSKPGKYLESNSRVFQTK